MTQSDEDHILDLVDGAVAKTDAAIRADMQQAILSIREAVANNLSLIGEVRTSCDLSTVRTQESVARLHARMDELGSQIQRVMDGQTQLADRYLEAATRTAEFDDAIQFWAEFKSRYGVVVTWTKRTFGLIFVALVIFAIETLITGRAHIG